MPGQAAQGQHLYRRAVVVDDIYLDDIGACSTAKEAWEILTEMHSKHGLLHVLQLMRDFFNVKKKKKENMTDYLGRLMELHRKLSSGGYGFTVRELALVMLMGLPDTYEPLILNLKQDEKTLTTRKVKARLLVEEKRQSRREEEKGSDNGEPKAMCTNKKGKTRYHIKKDDEKRANGSREDEADIEMIDPADRPHQTDVIVHLDDDPNEKRDEIQDTKLIQRRLPPGF
ncbi:hypothetical protein CBL_07176 [Carabus blaptoides fortunei]